MKDRGDAKDLFDLSQPETADAIRLHLLGDREGARAAFEKLVAREPRNYFFHYILGETKYAIGLLNEADVHYHRAIELKPDFGVAFYKMGVCHYRMGQLAKSLEAFTTLLSMKGQGHAMASYFFGLINQFLGNDQAAEEGFRILREESRQSLIANYYLAQIKIKHTRYAEALALLQELLLATPNLAEVHFLMGTAYRGMAKTMEAIQCFRKTLELNPEDKRAKAQLELLTDVQQP